MILPSLSAGPSVDSPPAPRTDGPAAPADRAGPALGPAPPIGHRQKGINRASI